MFIHKENKYDENLFMNGALAAETDMRFELQKNY